MSALWEASIDCDPDLVLPLLRRVSSTTMGFGPPEIAETMRTVENMAVHETSEGHFVIQHEGSAVPLRLRLTKGDAGAFEISFFTTPALAAVLDTLMSTFLEEHGL